ncbi:MAG: reverse transcriptase domain-containing protein [Candidatus Uhrbacteria bacterium]|nr:reverse transcriptase domain-containing protein [Candidatus Uhrbacteria bacterium]
MILYEELISLPRLLQAWESFRREKTNKHDVQIFSLNLEDNLFALHTALKQKNYRHSWYEAFWVNDPKRRHIHKACVTDRVLHHLLYTYLYELFDPIFIHDSYSCRVGKGTHKGVERLVYFARKESRNYTRECWALQFDVKQFFASAHHEVLKQLLAKKITDGDILNLIAQVIDSFNTQDAPGTGIPLGNLTSQIFANIYLHELDAYMKHQLKARFYARYADDGVVLSSSKEKLTKLILPIGDFLQKELKLLLHPRKLRIRKLSWGIDFLGYIVLPHYVLPRTKTKRRLLKRIRAIGVHDDAEPMVQSYLGYLSHAQTYRLQNLIKHIMYKLT